jgi:N-acetylglucosaminyldiphosphoundecaprenol N-acetyl-beta-D-mannosaminyltransferase
MTFSTPAPLDDARAAQAGDLAVPPPTTSVLGVPLALTDYERTMDWMDATVQTERKGYICVAATHTVVACQDDPELAAAVHGAALVVPDGQPVVWAMNALGHDLPSRARMFLYGGRNQGALVQLALNLRRRYPGVQIVGGYSPPFRALSEEEREAVVAEINHARPDVVWVGIGVPKQEKWMAEMQERLDAPVLVGVGAAFDFHAGLVPQAPSWMQSAGLEWLYRLLQEPRRLWRRYLTYNPRFVFGFARQYLRHRRDLARHGR